MREDMCYVLTDRPRYRGYKQHSYKAIRNSKKEKQTEIESLPRREGIRFRHKHGYDYKQFSDHISPLQRYLKAQVGRPWNKVYSEIRERISTGSTVQLHVLEHVAWFVATIVHRHPDGHLSDAQTALHYPLNDGELFVNAAGILCKYKGPKEKYRLKKGEKIYVIFREIGGVLYAFEDGTRYWYKFDVEEERVFARFEPGRQRERLHRFVAGSRTEAVAEIDKFRKANRYDRAIADNSIFVKRVA